MKAISLFGESIAAYSNSVSRQRRLNCFYDVRKDGDKNQIVIRGTPGATLWVTVPTAPIRGWHVVNNVLYVVGGQALYSVSTAGALSYLGSVSSGTTTLCSIVDNGVQLLIVDGSYGWVYTLVTGSYFQSALNAAGSLGKITDANFTSVLNGAISAAFIDGYGVVARPNSRQAYVSELYDFTHWTNTSSLPTYFTKENNSDQLAAVDVLNGTVVMWGTQTIEFWQDVGTYPGPFSRINGATQTWGLAAVYSRAFLNNTMIFLGQNPQGGVQVMMLSGYVPQRVSTSDIENLLSGFSTVSDALALTYIVDGHPMYQLTFPAAGRSFLFDSLTNIWYETQTGTALMARHFGNLGVAFNAQNYLSDATTGNLYLLSTLNYTDNGQPIKRVCASRHIHGDGNVLKISQLWLDLETGVGLQAGQGSNPKIMMRVSKDGGRTFPIERWGALGAVGQYLAPRAIWRRLGAARDFVFEFVMTDPVKFTIIKGAVSTDSNDQQ